MYAMRNKEKREMGWLVFAVILAILVSVFVGTQVKNANAGHECETVEIRADYGMSYLGSPANLVLRLEGDDAAKFASEADIEAEAVLVFDHPKSADVYVAIFNGGCRTGGKPLNADLFNSIMEKMGLDVRKAS